MKNVVLYRLSYAFHLLEVSALLYNRNSFIVQREIPN